MYITFCLWWVLLASSIKKFIAHLKSLERYALMSLRTYVWQHLKPLMETA